jgi:hypothetical protein
MPITASLAIHRHTSAVARATSIAAGCFFHWSLFGQA